MQLKAMKGALFVITLIVCCLFCVSGYLFFLRSDHFSQEAIASSKRNLPSSPFAFSPEAYAAIGAPVLHLACRPPRMHLPNLKPHLIYYGSNGRPDAKYERPKMHFGWQGGKTVISCFPGQKVYLAFDKKLSTGCKYTFAPENCETLVWFSADLDGNEAAVTVYMKDESGETLSDQDGNSSFALQEKEPLRTTIQGPWEIGKWRVDGTLLARQKARWMGVDCFLEKHGGEEFAEVAGKHRIDFTEADEPYSVFVKAGDYLIWEDNRWKESQGRTDTGDKPLLYIKKIEDRVMMCELWDVGGKGKLGLNLIRTPEPFAIQNVTNDFHFLGARTKTQVVFQVNQSRMLIKPNDWFILTPDGWLKVTKAQEVDDYVNRRLIGPLFVFEEIGKKEDGMVMVGTLFNPSRTEEHRIEVAMMTTGSLESSGPHEKEEIPRPVAVTPFATH
jgi:hypothetical protein